MTINGPSYQRYEELRWALEDVQRAFEQAANSWPTLTHRLFSAPDKSLSPEAWQAFAEANKDKTQDALWTLWEPFPSGGYCSQFVGEEKCFHRFRTLAESSMLVLGSMQEHYQAVASADSQFFLPGVKGHLGWLSLVYDTADLATALLRARKVPEGTPWVELDILLNDSWTETSECGLRIPLHPPFLQLHLDLFNSSSEAIRCWLYPEQVVSLWDRMGDAPIRLPSMAGEECEGESLESVAAEIVAVDPTSLNNRARPRYDRNYRALYVGDIRVKIFSKPAPAQEAILIAFEEDNWNGQINDPLRPKPDDDPKRRLGHTIRSLNNGLDDKKVIRFGADGTGEGVRWWYVD